MARATRFLSSTLGTKVVVAVTGIILLGFVLLHMLGNLKTFTGSDAHGVPHIDVYAHFLRTMGEPMVPAGFALWSTRVILFAALVVHVGMVLRLHALNRAARPIRYHHPQERVVSTVAARTMLLSGVLILVFVVIHVLHFTTGSLSLLPEVVPEEVYANLARAFRVWYVVVFYVIAAVLLGVHLYHGAWSMFLTLGLDNPDRNQALRWGAALAAAILVLGFCSVPLLFIIGVMPEPVP